MADVRPFRGLRYNPKVAGELSNIICPPFDTISPAMQKSLYQRSPHNVVRLESGERFATDTSESNRYTRAAALMKNWIEGQVMVRENRPSFYLIQHTFKLNGTDKRRLELMATVRLEEYERRVVLPHEYTRDEDKRDRLALMEACDANFSPIMCLYRDEANKLESIFQTTMAQLPMLDFRDAGDQAYKIWKIESGPRADEIRDTLITLPLYIADGHHRYETALEYKGLKIPAQDSAILRTAAGGKDAEEAAVNFVMMGLIGFDDPGLVVLPYHRVVGGLDESSLARVRARLKELFDDEPFESGSSTAARGESGRGGRHLHPFGKLRAGSSLPPSRGKGIDLEEFLEAIEVKGRDQKVIGLLDSEIDGYQLLTLKQDVNLGSAGPLAQSEAWVLESQVLRPILGDSLGKHVDYFHDGNEMEDKVRGHEFQLGFLLKPFPLDLFETIMNLGQRLPPKSTFFYPKLPAGIVINSLEGSI